MVIGETVGVGIFLTPATMVRTVGTAGRALAVWGVIGLLTMAGALCYAELATRFPRAGGTYVYLREAFGTRWAFVYGWMTLLVIDPGLTAALGIGAAQYLSVLVGAPPTVLVPLAIGIVLMFGTLTLGGMRLSARIMRWTVIAKLIAVAVLAVAALVHAREPAAIERAASAPQGLGTLAPAVIAAFFAFGGWWDLGRMSEEVESPRRTLPKALLGGVIAVTALYAVVTIALLLTTPPGAATSGEALVDHAGAALFGDSASRLLPAIVVVAVAGSLAAVMLCAPRVYMAMARDGVLPSHLALPDEQRGVLAGATVVQVGLACVLIMLSSFDQILGYFVPGAVFFLGVSAAAMFVLPRPSPNDQAFIAPFYPVPTLLFLALMAIVLLLFASGQPRETLIGAIVVAMGVPVSYLVDRMKGHRDQGEGEVPC